MCMQQQRAIDCLAAEEKLERLRENIRTQLSGHEIQQPGISIAIRMPSGPKMQKMFALNATAQVSTIIIESAF